jgi:alpha-ketoglutarate-dependent taurine dioxygenase
LGDRVIERLETYSCFAVQSLNDPISQSLNEVSMYHYDPTTALEELTEDATLPNPVHVRDMILRKHPSTEKALELNRLFLEYQKFFGEAQKLGKEILKQLVG